MKFSFIVPVYNVEKYVKKCIDSILNIKYENIEIIIINDGSIDNSLNIIRNNYQNIEKVKIINKKNGGLSSARNVGIKIASGDYLIFVDSDDYINPSAFESILQAANTNCDVIITRIIGFSNQNKIEEKKFEDINIKKLNKNDAIQLNFKSLYYTWPAPKLIISSNLIKKNIQFSNGFLHEDVKWTTDIFLISQTFLLVTNDWYYYRINNNNSITSNLNTKRLFDCNNIIRQSIESVENSLLNKAEKHIICQRLVKSLFTNRKLFQLMNSTEKKEFIKIFQNNYNCYKKYMDYSKGYVMNIFIKLFGCTIYWNIISKI